ncbi:hypothetical protein ABDK56_04340 [Sphingomonas sp. ASV193]|uniref:hypothetical protein n=1 Tax=Sphingomonas sp. ASV193 TaxID=3144405 RepID=UPI0032E8A234
METPRDAVEATLAMIAAALAGEGFALKPGLKIKRVDGDYTDVIRTQTSVWNRTDTQAWFTLTAVIESGRFGRFLKARWPDRPANVSRHDRFVTSRQLKKPGTNLTCRWDAILPGDRAAIAEEATGNIRTQILPWFAAMRDPLAVVRQIPGPFAGTRLLHYALANGLEREMRAHLVEVSQKVPAFGEAMARMKAGTMDRRPGNSFDEIALRAIELGLA